jgi:ribonuclease P protein component
VSFNFPREARLTKAKEFESAFKDGFRVRVPPLRVQALRRTSARGQGAEHSRLGLVVPKQVGSAAVRNRWKRAIRETFRLHRHELPAAYDLVIGVEWESGQNDINRVGDSFRRLIDKLREREAAR